MSKKILGIDPSSRSTGLVMLEMRAVDVVLAEAVVKKSGTHDWTRVREIQHEVGEFCGPLVTNRNPQPETQIDLAVIEGYALSAGGRQSSSVTKLVEVGTAIRIELDERCIPWIVVVPSQLKKFVGAKAAKSGSRIARNKNPVKQACERHWGFTAKSNDIVDAYCLAQIGASCLLRRYYKTPAQIEVAATLRPAVGTAVARAASLT